MGQLDEDLTCSSPANSRAVCCFRIQQPEHHGPNLCYCTRAHCTHLHTHKLTDELLVLYISLQLYEGDIYYMLYAFMFYIYFILMAVLTTVCKPNCPLGDNKVYPILS